MQCRQPPTCPWDHCWFFCSPVLPCTAGWNLLGRYLCGSFCIAATCVGFPQPPKLTLCVAGLAWTWLSSWGSPFVSQPCEHLSQLPGGRPGFCAARLLCTCFSSPSWPLCHGASVELFRLPVPTLCLMGFMCTCFASPALCRGGCLIFQLSQEGCVCYPSLYASPLSAPQSLPLWQLFALSHSATWACPLCCKGCACWLGLSAASHSAGFICHATWRLGVFCVTWRLLCRSCSISWWVFHVFRGRLAISPL